jgi:hypothetical protein
MTKINVNGRNKNWIRDEISFTDVIALAFSLFDPEKTYIEYTLTYSHGPKDKPQGSMVSGDSIKIIDRMIFNITATNRA